MSNSWSNYFNNQSADDLRQELEWEAEEERINQGVMDGLRDNGVELTSLNGMLPLQGMGYYDQDKPLYFRMRHGVASLKIWEPRWPLAFYPTYVDDPVLYAEVTAPEGAFNSIEEGLAIWSKLLDGLEENPPRTHASEHPDDVNADDVLPLLPDWLQVVDIRGNWRKGATLVTQVGSAVIHTSWGTKNLRAVDSGRNRLRMASRLQLLLDHSWTRSVTHAESYIGGTMTADGVMASIKVCLLRAVSSQEQMNMFQSDQRTELRDILDSAGWTPQWSVDL